MEASGASTSVRPSGLRLGERCKRNAAALPRPVLDDERLAQDRTDPFGDQTGDDIRRLPRRKSDDDARHFGRLRLRGKEDRQRGKR